MIKLTRCFDDPRRFKAVTGMSYVEFMKLLPAFEVALKSSEQESRFPRRRQEGGGRQHTLKNGQDQLFFIVFYLKCYPTFDVLAWLFGVDRAQPHRWVTTYLPILERALGQTAVLPERKIHTVVDFVQRFPKCQEVFVDGTERPVRRPLGKEMQPLYYSGKKKGIG